MYPEGSNKERIPSSPSKIRGGRGALKTDEQENTAHIFNIPEMKAYRRELRTNTTPAERALWNWLKRKQVKGLQFRRQFSVGNHILDFYCPALKLAIELDGDYHHHMVMPEKDWRRDQELLLKHGIKTLRFENNVVFEHPYVIINAILQEYESFTNHNDGGQRPPTPSNLRGGVNPTEQ